jgi:hypothetical protein
MSNRHYQHQQLLIHHSASLVQNNYTLNVILKLRAEEVSAEAHSLAYTLGPKTRISDEINFVICQSCFWCASCVSSKILSIMAAAEDSESFAKCPSCVEGNIESIPIAENENYRFNYDTKRGVTMEFFRCNKS